MCVEKNLDLMSLIIVMVMPIKTHSVHLGVGSGLQLNVVTFCWSMHTFCLFLYAQITVLMSAFSLVWTYRSIPAVL